MEIVFLFAVIWFILGLINLGKGIYYKFDHSYWDENSQPSLNAGIVDVVSEKVQYTKNNAKFKTTVTFTDGFRFVTHRTDRTQHFMTYDISVDKAEVIALAMEAHKKAVEKKVKIT